jgi:cystathionine beta-lyase family protein involved in aluminum resistance
MTENNLQKYVSEHFNIDEKIVAFVDDCEREVEAFFKKHRKIAETNQYKVIHAFQKNSVSVRHFSPTTGYGYSDEGREKLSKVFADAFDAEDAIASPLFMSGTQAISTALFGLLRPGDTMLCVTGTPYDTFLSVIHGKKGFGSLEEWGIRYREQLLAGGQIDAQSAIKTITADPSVKLVYIQRSCGYDLRSALSSEEIGRVAKSIHAVFPSVIIFVDNCYGEFTEINEPTTFGADIMAGSLIKNPGGGVAPTGGYVAGRKTLVEQISHRHSAPGLGSEIGSYAASYLPFFQGLFLAPHTVCQAKMGVILAASVFEKLGYTVYPRPDDPRPDIAQTILFGNEEALTSFVRGIQKASAIDGNVVPFAWDMPGYPDKVIMAAGTFIQGASLELTADAPIREPYVAYMQGALTYEHAKLGILYAMRELKVEL